MTEGKPPVELIVRQHGDSDSYRVYWGDGLDGLSNLAVPSEWLDLIPFMAARFLVVEGYDTERPYVVRLEGADTNMMRTTLGHAAATPVLNATPIALAPRHRASVVRFPVLGGTWGPLTPKSVSTGF